MKIGRSYGFLIVTESKTKKNTRDINSVRGGFKIKRNKTKCYCLSNWERVFTAIAVVPYFVYFKFDVYVSSFVSWWWIRGTALGFTPAYMIYDWWWSRTCLSRGSPVGRCFCMHPTHCTWQTLSEVLSTEDVYHLNLFCQQTMDRAVHSMKVFLFFSRPLWTKLLTMVGGQRLSFAGWVTAVETMVHCHRHCWASARGTRRTTVTAIQGLWDRRPSSTWVGSNAHPRAAATPGRHCSRGSHGRTGRRLWD